jgi:hypothetical protein
MTGNKPNIIGQQGNIWIKNSNLFEKHRRTTLQTKTKRNQRISKNGKNPDGKCHN